jgi:hypothetical protein
VTFVLRQSRCIFAFLAWDSWNRSIYKEMQTRGSFLKLTLREEMSLTAPGTPPGWLSSRKESKVVPILN